MSDSEHVLWLTIADAFQAYAETGIEQPSYVVCGLCYAVEELADFYLQRRRMKERIKPYLPPHEVYISPYGREFAANRARIAREIAATVLRENEPVEGPSAAQCDEILGQAHYNT
jgi:hypothetical protein